ncbi:acyl-CoA dehydrogenase family protein [Allonocardiopsis opalescens]|uniref:Alkylation response protein AidB-like acyl-CoA dehydrogenase n=1 Tax=Allonocardiopsis opalescens TaxID=1144618 RepID=A0A2T0PYA5_9ACTN|nr:acyl-CoA dehydrogenase family protein [Allonocardiopsis opalescens]PRX96513.1 alkylation response protein AidB-like acyl-CoA dehydrogenase [Allonocardiopsis opalescens]
MRFEDDDTERKLREEVGRVLAEPDVAELLAEVRTSGLAEPDVRPLYRALGRRGLLAVGWPVRYGGRDAGHAAAAAVAEELVAAGVPDMLHVLSVQIVGAFLAQAGTDEQKERHLPALAAGERFATVLYTEPETGSDLAALRCAAVRDGDGHRLTGTKVWGLKSSFSDLALCAARTSRGASKYDGISLFLVDLNADGVSVGSVPGIADEQFDRVELDGVHVPAADLLGEEDEGWPLLNRCLAVERTGLDYSLKARTWFTAALAGIGAADDALAEAVGRRGAQAEAARLLAWEVISGLDRGEADPVAAARAKYYTSEAAQEIAVWAALVHGADYGWRELPADAARTLEAAYREAPGLTLSAGTSEMMLELVASALPGRSGEEAAGGPTS